MTVKDVSPVEKKREMKARKGELEEETKTRKLKKEKPPEEEKKEAKPKPPAEEKEAKPKPPAEEKEAKPKPPAEEEAKKEAKKKAREKKPKVVEKIKYHAKKEVPGLMLKKKKPKFRRQEHYKIRLKPVWRKPRGIDSKKHEGKRGKGKSPSIGYGKPSAIKGLHPLGYAPVLVHNIAELTKLDSKREGAIIASAVGRRKRNDIIKEANKLKINILNPRKGEI